MDQEKAKLFVGRLVGNPALAAFNSLQREEQIMQFLRENQRQLQPTLASPQFFGQKSWREIAELLYAALAEHTIQKAQEELRKMVTGRINFGFIPFFRQQTVGSQEVQTQILKVLDVLLKRPDARRGLAGALCAVQYGIAGTYVDEIYKRKSYGYIEFTKVQRLRMGVEEVKGLVDVSLLLMPTVSLHMAEGQYGNQNGAKQVNAALADKVIASLRNILSYLPDQILESAVHANMSFEENRSVEASARIASLFSDRCHHYQPNQQVDKGAESPDKSWINIARKNYKFYGYDIKLLDELYMIAAENNW